MSTVASCRTIELTEEFVQNNCYKHYSCSNAVRKKFIISENTLFVFDGTSSLQEVVDLYDPSTTISIPPYRLDYKACNGKLYSVIEKEIFSTSLDGQVTELLGDFFESYRCCVIGVVDDLFALKIAGRFGNSIKIYDKSMNLVYSENDIDFPQISFTKLNDRYYLCGESLGSNFLYSILGEKTDEIILKDLITYKGINFQLCSVNSNSIVVCRNRGQYLYFDLESELYELAVRGVNEICPFLHLVTGYLVLHVSHDKIYFVVEDDSTYNIYSFLINSPSKSSKF